MPDVSSLDTEAALEEAKQWTIDGGYPSLYRFGLEGKPEDATPSESFLYQVAAAFFGGLTDLPENFCGRFPLQSAQSILRKNGFGTYSGSFRQSSPKKSQTTTVRWRCT